MTKVFLKWLAMHQDAVENGSRLGAQGRQSPCFSSGYLEPLALECVVHAVHDIIPLINIWPCH